MSVARLASRLALLLRLRPTMPISVPRSPADEPAAKRMKMDPIAAVGAGVAPTMPSSASSPAPDTPTISKNMQKKMKAKAPVPSFRPLETPPTADDLASLESLMASPSEVEKQYAHEIEYRNKLVLAPMVRSGTLPVRLLSLYYGAGLVWTPEIVDKAIIGAERIVDPETGVITYHKGQGPIFTCHPIEKPFLIFQIGSSDPELAVQAARVVAQDVSGIDLNCGCPKPFSTHAGMGAALLSTPDLLLSIIRALIAAIPLPISAKIRLLPTRAETSHLAARILRTGVRNLTVHCRTRDMRPRERAIHDRLAEVVALGRRRGISVTCNGDGEGWENWEAIKTATGADSLMIARAAESNPSIFASPSVDVTTVVVPQLLSWVAYTSHNWGNTKFLLSQFKAAGPTLTKQQRKDAMQAVARGKSVAEVTEMLNAVVPVEVSAEKGKEFTVELEKRLKSRPEWALWETCEKKRDEEVAGALAAAAAVEKVAAEKAAAEKAAEEKAAEETAAEEVDAAQEPAPAAPAVSDAAEPTPAPSVEANTEPAVAAAA